MPRLTFAALFFAFACAGPQALAADAPSPEGLEFFESKIRPVLVDRCYSCHSATSEKLKGGLRCDCREGLLKGGENGPAIVPGSLEKSRLIKAIRYEDDEMLMPPKKKLTPQQVADFEKWVQMGAPDPRNEPLQAVAAKPALNFDEARKFWSFQPVKVSPTPKVKDTAWPQSDLDAFILATLESKSLKPAKPADKRTLIRRATFDLTGLPPTPDEIRAFESNTSADAFAKVVDRLLASPHYGERWGRHWLDIVRYADTAGETADYPVPLAWRYRNYVINAFNQDKPYDQFLNEQLAGDILAPGGPPEKYAERITATGYLAISRRFGFDSENYMHLTIEDTLDTLGKSVLGLSVGCARCHDHKFDPIGNADYYALYGFFDSTRYAFPGDEQKKKSSGMIPLLSQPEIEKLTKPLADSLVPLDAELKKLEAEKAALDKESKAHSGRLKATLASGDIPNGGAQEFSAGKGAESLRSLEVKAGDMIQILILPKETYYNDSTIIELEITELSGAKRVWNLARDIVPDLYAGGKGNPHSDSFGNAKVWYFFDAMNDGKLFTTFVDAAKNNGLHAWRNAEDTPCIMVQPKDTPLTLVTAKLPARCVAVHPSPKGGVAIGWESPLSGTVQITGRVIDADDKNGDGVAWELIHGESLGKALAENKKIGDAIAELKKKRDALAAATPPVEKTYAVAEGVAKNAKLQRRGDPKNLGEEVPRRFLRVLGGQTLPPDCTGSGRLQLAHWLSSPDNPLTARVMANRIFQYHFGRGIVRTPNDFGTRGRAPTHPELLDYLAAYFVKNGWSMKQMHKFMMLSRTYQLASEDNPANTAIDHDNEFLWRFNPRRLEAEEIRDSILAVSGDLDRTPGTAHPFPPEDKWGYTQHAPFTAVYETDKRSIYLMTQRIKRHPFLALFDGADPNSTTPDRRLTIVPTQALFFMNDPFVHAKASKLASRLCAANPGEGQRIDFAWQNIFGRNASTKEREQAQNFLHAYVLESKNSGVAPDKSELTAWSAYVRVLFSCDEFIHLD